MNQSFTEVSGPFFPRAAAALLERRRISEMPKTGINLQRASAGDGLMHHACAIQEVLRSMLAQLQHHVILTTQEQNNL